MNSPLRSPEFTFDALLARLSLASATQQAAAEQEARFAVRFLGLTPGARIIDAPCGVGRHAWRLAEHGCHVTAVDASQDCIDIAERKFARSGIKFLLRDLRHCQDLFGHFDALLSLYSCIGYEADELADAALMSVLMSLLTPSGGFVISTANRTFVERERYRQIRFEEDGFDVLRCDRIDPSTGLLETKLQLERGGQRFAYHQLRRIYSRQEMVGRLERAGAGEVNCYGGFDGASFSDHDSPHAIYVGRRVC